MSSDGKGLVSQAGTVLLWETMRVTGLGRGLSEGPGPVAGAAAVHDPGKIVADLAAAVALGGDCLADIAVLREQPELAGPVASDPVVSRLVSQLAGDLPRALKAIRSARAAARERTWALAGDAAPGAGGGLVTVDLDATIVIAHSPKEKAAATYKSGFGFHPLGCWCANTGESLAMELRPGNAGSNTASDHVSGLSAALAQIPARYRRNVIVRLDGAGASHDFIEHMLNLKIPDGKLLFTCGWTITETDEADIREIPEEAWKPGVTQDGRAGEDTDVAEITGLMSRSGNWPGGLRWIVRRVKPSRRHLKKLTAYEKETGWKYSIICTNIPEEGIEGVPGSRACPVHRCAAPSACRRRGRRAHRQGRRPAQSSLEVLEGEPRLGRGGEHRR